MVVASGRYTVYLYVPKLQATQQIFYCHLHKKASVIFAKIRIAAVNNILTAGNSFIAFVEIEMDNCTICLTELDVVQCEADG